ncbi:tail Collar domain-containing protein [Capsulimonas corticalis]|uniref:Tail Collar domain-containing protein n=1 Tax=Capsulimonas corticalis TaxID=2219043 RepID=A0A402D0P3_9BACT|nr:tail fiber protein [Capsulimonas corticalis]BDI33581.1 tail Collar domain-containing protein [Capsulimonas corticalis]
MSEPYIGEIRLVGFSFAPVGWAFCDGSLQSIAENTTLFQIIGTTYGGDGQNTFALPNLQGRVPIHQGNGFVIGQIAGSETVTLTSQQLPSHKHALAASTGAATSTSPANANLAASGIDVYISPTSPVSTTTSSTAAGGGQPHENMMPFTCINYIIALFGVFPSQN